MNENNTYKVEEWWTDWQKELIEDNHRIWIKQKFKAVPGFWIIENGNKILGKVSQHEDVPKDAVLDPTAWDHEHCSLCWETISEFNTQQQEGYTDQKEWLCIECYDKYVAPRRKK